jgi:hypothetical protein
MKVKQKQLKKFNNIVIFLSSFLTTNTVLKITIKIKNNIEIILKIKFSFGSNKTLIPWKSNKDKIYII